MKTKSIILSALIMVGVVVSGSANPGKTGMVVVHANGTQTVKVIYKGESAGKVKLNLYNESSNLIFSETFSKIEAFILPLNFTGLESGKYTVELTDADGKKIKSIVNYNIAASTDKFVRISKLDNANGKYLVSVVGKQSASQKVRVRIYSDESLIYDAPKDVNGEYAEVFNVKSRLGRLTIQVSDDEGTLLTKAF